MPRKRARFHGSFSSFSSTTDEDIVTPVYQVEQILSDCVHEGEKLYLVKWLGYSSKENSWEPKESFRDVETLRRYEEAKIKARKGQRTGKKPTWKRTELNGRRRKKEVLCDKPSKVSVDSKKTVRSTKRVFRSLPGAKIVKEESQEATRSDSIGSIDSDDLPLTEITERIKLQKQARTSIIKSDPETLDVSNSTPGKNHILDLFRNLRGGTQVYQAKDLQFYNTRVALTNSLMNLKEEKEEQMKMTMA